MPQSQVGYFYNYALGIGYVERRVVFDDVGTSMRVHAATLNDGQIRLRLTPRISYFAVGRPGTIDFTEGATEIVVANGQLVSLDGSTGRMHEVTQQILGYRNRSSSDENYSRSARRFNRFHLTVKLAPVTPVVAAIRPVASWKFHEEKRMNWLFGLVIACCVASSVFAQSAGEPLPVATRIVKPFVFEEKGKLTGFSIELWNEIAKQLNVKSAFVVKPTVKDLLDALKSQQAALGIAAISITAERELELDFSQPMFDAGLQILAPVRGDRTALIRSILANLFSAAVIPYVLAVALILLVIAHLVWWFEQRHPSGMLTDNNYFPGIFEVCWWAASTLATQADQMPRAALARMVAVFWMFASVVFIAYFTAAVTSNLTLQQLRSDINGPEDLPGKRVASVKGSTASEYLRQQNIEAMDYAKVEDAYPALQHGQLDAVVYDAPVLLYFASHEGKGRFHTVGAIFRKENYGIAFPDKSPLRKRVNEALLKLKENGTYDLLYAKWFGGTGS